MMVIFEGFFCNRVKVNELSDSGTFHLTGENSLACANKVHIIRAVYFVCLRRQIKRTNRERWEDRTYLAIQRWDRDSSGRRETGEDWRSQMSKQLEGDDLRAETASYYSPARSPRLHHLFYPRWSTVCSCVSFWLCCTVTTKVCLKTAYLILCFSNISGSVALSDATKLPTGMFSILVTIRGSGKNTGPSLMSSTLTWTVAVELGPYPTSGTRGSSFSTLMSRLRNSDAS